MTAALTLQEMKELLEGTFGKINVRETKINRPILVYESSHIKPYTATFEKGLVRVDAISKDRTRSFRAVIFCNTNAEEDVIQTMFNQIASHGGCVAYAAGTETEHSKPVKYDSENKVFREVELDGIDSFGKFKFV